MAELVLTFVAEVDLAPNDITVVNPETGKVCVYDRENSQRYSLGIVVSKIGAEELVFVGPAGATVEFKDAHVPVNVVNKAVCLSVAWDSSPVWIGEHR